jgi:hypothetical protein
MSEEKPIRPAKVFENGHWRDGTEEERQRAAGRVVVESPVNEHGSNAGGLFDLPDWLSITMRAQAKEKRQQRLDSNEEECVPWLRD